MSRIWFGVLIGLVLVSAGCGYSSHNYMNGGGGLRLTQLMPNTAMPGGSAFTLTVMGTGFGTDSIIYFGGAPQTTTFKSTTQVTAGISAADIASAGSAQVYVRSGGANSNAVTFTVQ